MSVPSVKIKGWTYWHAGDLIKQGHLSIGDGYRAKNSEMGEGGLPFARAGNINNGFHFDDADILSAESVAKAGDKLSVPGDVTFTSKGTFGRFAFVQPWTPPFVYSPQLCYWRVHNNSVLHNRFLYYWMQGDECLGQLEQIKGLTDMADYVSLSNQRKMWISAPPLPTQRKIAAILSAYDDLIENNLRRIKILEEIAQRLYREWFVHFRFPGHENVRMVDSPLGPIPEGWEVVKFENVITLAYGKALKSEDRQPGDVPVYGSSGIVGYHNEALVDGPAIILGRKGNVGAVHYSDVDFFPIDTVYYVETDLPLTYVFHTLNGLHFINSDAAVPGLSRRQAYTLNVLRPADFILNAYDSYAVKLNEMRLNLERQNENLRRTRDLLLPRLISGELDVSELDIEVPEADVLPAPPPPPVSEPRVTPPKVSVRAEPKLPQLTTKDTPPTDITTEAIIAAIRQAFGAAMRLDREDLMKATSVELGYTRLGKRVAKAITGGVNAAIRRGVLEDRDGSLWLTAPNLQSHDREVLIASITSCMRKNGVTTDEDLMREVLVHLGFQRLTSHAEEAMKGAIRTAIRRGILQREGELLRRIS